MKDKKLFRNERLVINRQGGVVEAVFSFTYKNYQIKKYYFINKKEDVRDIINHEKENGTLLKYAKRYSRKLYWTNSRKAWMACGAVLAAGAIAVGVYFTIQVLNSPTENLWPKISVDEAKEIIANFEAKQKLMPSFNEETGEIEYKIDENNLGLIGTLNENGGQGRVIDKGHSQITSEGTTDEYTSSYNIPFNIIDNNLYFMDPVEENDDYNNLGAEFGPSGYFLYRNDLPSGNAKTVYFYTDEEGGLYIKEGMKPKKCSIAGEFEKADIDIENAKKIFEKKYFYDITPKNENENIKKESLASLLFGVNTKHITTNFTEINPGILTLTDLYFDYPKGYEKQTEVPGGIFYVNEKFDNVCFRSISKNTISIDIEVNVYRQQSNEMTESLYTDEAKIKLTGKIINGICVEEKVYQKEEIKLETNGTITEEASYIYDGAHSLIFTDVPIPDTTGWPLPETSENYNYI